MIRKWWALVLGAIYFTEVEESTPTDIWAVETEAEPWE